MADRVKARNREGDDGNRSVHTPGASGFAPGTDGERQVAGGGHVRQVRLRAATGEAGRMRRAEVYSGRSPQLARPPDFRGLWSLRSRRGYRLRQKPDSPFDLVGIKSRIAHDEANQFGPGIV